jgi:hypothetical protein
MSGHRDGGRLIAKKGAGAGGDADEPAQVEVSRWCMADRNGHTAASVGPDAANDNHHCDAAQTDPAETRARRCGGLTLSVGSQPDRLEGRVGCPECRYWGDVITACIFNSPQIFWPSCVPAQPAGACGVVLINKR